jgi:hypothetical protein
MLKRHTDYICIAFCAFICLTFIIGIICACYAGVRINMASAANGPMEQIFIVGVALLSISGFIILLTTCFLLFDKINEQSKVRIKDLGPKIVVKPQAKRLAKQKPDSPIPDPAYYMSKENPVVKIKRGSH